MRCRLLYLIGQLGAGGSERQLFYLLRAMDRHRYNPAVAVWHYCESDRYVSQIQALGVPLYDFRGACSAVSKLRAFRRLVRGLQPEVLHSYSFYTNFAAWAAADGSLTTPIGSIRGDFISERQASGQLLGRLSAHLPKTQICNSAAAQKTVGRSSWPFKPSRTYLVRNGLDTDELKPAPLPPSGSSLLAVGRLHADKRWDRLLRVASSVHAKGLRFTVRVAGEGPLLTELQSQARQLGLANVVHFLGVCDDIGRLLSESSFVVHTADTEGYPNTIMEAMAHARAVISTDVGDVPSLVEDGTTGFVVRRGDDDTFARQMTRLLTDQDLCRRMGEAGRVRAERTFGLDRLITETLDAYRAAGWKDV